MLAKAAASLLSFHAGSRSICSAAAMKQKDTSKLLESLRRLMAENSLAGYIVPSEDAHQSEYIADTDCRRAFVSGFTGSAGRYLLGGISACALRPPRWGHLCLC